MPKQPSRSRPKAKQPYKKPLKTPSAFYNAPAPMASSELMRPSTNSKPSFNRQLEEEPYLNPAREIFKRSHERIMAARAPKTQVQAGSLVAAFTERKIFEKLLTQHQDEIERLSRELAAEKQENTELKAKLVVAQGLQPNKRKRLGGQFSVELDLQD